MKKLNDHNPAPPKEDKNNIELGGRGLVVWINNIDVE